MSQTHVISRRPPLRAIALAAGAAIFGACCILLADLTGWSIALSILGWVILAGALVLAGAAIWAARAATVRVVLDPSGFEVIGPDGTHTDSWTEVTRVTTVGNRIVLYHRDGSSASLVAPLGSRANVDALATEMAGYLDADRGYGS